MCTHRHCLCSEGVSSVRGSATEWSWSELVFRSMIRLLRPSVCSCRHPSPENGSADMLYSESIVSCRGRSASPDAAAAARLARVIENTFARSIDRFVRSLVRNPLPSIDYPIILTRCYARTTGDRSQRPYVLDSKGLVYKAFHLVEDASRVVDRSCLVYAPMFTIND